MGAGKELASDCDGDGSFILCLRSPKKAITCSLQNLSKTSTMGTLQWNVLWTRLIGDACVGADPARAGLGKPVIEYLMGCGARLLLYVSCNPATQARDILRLTDAADPNRFQLESVQPVDMFAHTEHIESVAVLRRHVGAHVTRV